MIPYGRQAVDDQDIAAVVDVLKGDWLTQGPAVEAFETAVSDYLEVEHVVAFSSGTAALHGAAAAAGLGPGDVVVTSPLTFMASANCARYVGAAPALVDIDLETWNLDLAEVPGSASAVVPVHYAGLPADLGRMPVRPRIVIEDAAHAFGARTADGPVGNCARSDMCCFSFHPVKPITTGEGGAVTTNDASLAAALRRFRTHGAVPRPESGGWCYDIAEIGFNYRMTDIHAALGLAQLAKVERFIARRNELAERYRAVLADLPVGLPPEAPDGTRHGYHIFPVRVAHRRRVYEGLRGAGIGVQVHYRPVHHHAISADIGLEPGDLPRCDALYEELLSLPLYPGLTEAEQDTVVHELTRLVGQDRG